MVAAIRAEDLKQIDSGTARGRHQSGARFAGRARLGGGRRAQPAERMRSLSNRRRDVGKTIDVVGGGVVKLSRTVFDAASLEREVQRTIAASGVSDPSVIARQSRPVAMSKA